MERLSLSLSFYHNIKHGKFMGNKKNNGWVFPDGEGNTGNKRMLSESQRRLLEEKRRRELHIQRMKTDPAYRKMVEEKIRQKKEAALKEKLKRRKIIRNRIILFLSFLGIILLVTGSIFIFNFLRSPDKNERTVKYYLGKNSEEITLSNDLAYKNSVLYAPFSQIAKYSKLAVVGDSGGIRFVAVSDNTDSASGTSSDEYAYFTHDSTDVVVNKRALRMDSPAVFVGSDVYVPLSFIKNYMSGLTVSEEGNIIRISINVTEETDENKDKVTKEDKVTFILKSEAPISGEESQPDNSIPTSTIPDVSFSSDLSSYEQYMNPTDSSKFLLLVNKENSLDNTYIPENLVNISNTRQDGRSTQQMVETAAKALEALYMEMKAAGYTDVSVTSAYRSYSYQEQLYNNYVSGEMKSDPSISKDEAIRRADLYSAQAGKSEHQTGLCCDMHNLPSADVKFANEKAYSWLQENAWKFGYVLRFPEDKTNITGYSFEPWHYRFVGRENAYKIKEMNMCLEEYISYINDN